MTEGAAGFRIKDYRTPAPRTAESQLATINKIPWANKKQASQHQDP